MSGRFRRYGSGRAGGVKYPMRSVVSLLAVLSLQILSLPASAADVVAPVASAEAGSGAPSAAASASASVPGLAGVMPVPALPSALISAPSAFSAPAPAAAAAAAARAPVPALAPAAASAVAVPTDAATNPAAVSAPAAEPISPEAVPAASVPVRDASAAMAPGAASATHPAAPARGARTLRFAAAIARALSPGKRDESSLPATSAAASAAAASGLSAASAASAPHAASVDAATPAATAVPGKRSFMAGTFVYNLATSVMLVVQQALFFSLAQADQVARGFSAGAASLHAAGIVFALATLTGAMRIPGNSLGAWLSARTDQRTLSVVSSGARAAILAGVAALVFFHQITLPVAALLYSADWLIGGLEEVSRNTQTPALVKPGSTEFKAWSTLSQFLAQLTGLFGPLFVIALAQFKGLDAAGHVLAPLLFVAAALFYAKIPADAFHRGSASADAPEARVSRLEKWRAFVADRSLFLPALALALMSVLLLKGPLSLNMASLLLGKSGSSLVTYSALLSGLFGAGLGAGTWIAHVSKGGEAARRAPSRWLALAALSTVALAGSWIFGASPALALPAIAAAWFFFALANAAGQALLMHGLQERVAAAGADKKYAIGLTLTMANTLITILRVLAGLIFFVAAKNWQTAFGLFAGLMLLVASGQWLLARRMGRAARVG